MNELLHPIVDKGIIVRWMFWCHGCHASHSLPVTPWRHRPYIPYGQRAEPKNAQENIFGPEQDGPVWQFNGNRDKPTFTPSLWYKDKPSCHVVITDGVLYFCPDCDHKLAGQSVPMESEPL